MPSLEPPHPIDAAALRTLAPSPEAQTHLLDAILNASDDLTFVIGADGRYLYVSTAAARAAGVPRDRMVGRSAAELGLQGDIAAQLAAARDQVLATGEPVSGEMRHPDGAGGEVAFLYSYAPLPLVPNPLGALICTARDVTQQRRTEAAANARLRAASQRDHDIAATLQRSLLQMPLPDAFPGLEVVSRYLSATADMEIGGDFIDAFLLDGSRVALVVGDVTGKGLGAAARIAEAKFTLRGYLREYPSCGIGLMRLNTYLCAVPTWEGQQSEGFVCLSVAILDTTTGELTASVAGAETPLLFRADGRAESLNAQGMPLGVMPNTDYLSVTAQMAAGDMLLLTTDGITEARREGVLFGLDGVRHAAETGTGISTAALADRVMAAATAFAGGALSDDATLLLARRVIPKSADVRPQ